MASAGLSSNELAGLLPGLHATPAYRTLLEQTLKDKDAISQVARSAAEALKKAGLAP